MENKIKSLAEMLQLPYDVVSAQVKNMENAGYNEEERIIIIDHFMSGGMLSEIIAPPQKAKTSDPVISMQEFDLFFFNRRNEVPGLADQLIEQWARRRRWNKQYLTARNSGFFYNWKNKDYSYSKIACTNPCSFLLFYLLNKNMKVKILHRNIWFQEKAENIVKLVKKINPDILCFQEVTIGSNFNAKRDVAKYIAEELGYQYNFSSAHKYEFPITPKGESNYGGNAIFSRFPITKNSNFPIINPKDLPTFAYERRTCAVSEIQIGNKKNITIATTHKSYSSWFIEDQEKIKETKKLVNFFKKNPKNLIFTGDLNLSPDTKSIKLIEKQLKHCGPDYNEPTWTTKPFSFMGFEETKLKRRIDYIFASKDIKVIHSKIIKTKYSDHLPILVEIEM